jgi:uncharacterized protein DUF6290
MEINIMPTKNPRLNVTFDPTLASLITSLAKSENKSVSSMTKELILEALDRREDMALSAIAEARENEPLSTTSHENIWK